MGLVSLSTRMKSAASMSVGAAARLDGELTIRLSPIVPGSIPGIPVTSTWAWAVVLETSGDSNPDALLAGGHGDSLSGVTAMAEQELKRQAAKRAAEKAKAHGVR